MRASTSEARRIRGGHRHYPAVTRSSRGRTRRYAALGMSMPPPPPPLDEHGSVPGPMSPAGEPLAPPSLRIIVRSMAVILGGDQLLRGLARARHRRLARFQRHRRGRRLLAVVRRVGDRRRHRLRLGRRADPPVRRHADQAGLRPLPWSGPTTGARWSGVTPSLAGRPGATAVPTSGAAGLLLRFEVVVSSSHPHEPLRQAVWDQVPRRSSSDPLEASTGTPR